MRALPQEYCTAVERKVWRGEFQRLSKFKLNLVSTIRLYLDVIIVQQLGARALKLGN